MGFHFILQFALLVIVPVLCTDIGSDNDNAIDNINVIATTSQESIVIVTNAINNNDDVQTKQNISVLFEINTVNVGLGLGGDGDGDGEDDETTAQRLPHELAIVLDSSGSMQGNALAFCIASIRKIIDDLMDGDLLHLISYNSDATVIFENGNSKNKEYLFSQLSFIYATGVTNLYSGLRKAKSILTTRNKKKRKWKRDDAYASQSSDATGTVAQTSVARNQRMFVFSDGLINAGKYVAQEDILRKIDEWKIKYGITFSSFGVGNAFNRELMFNMSIVGEGDFFYIQHENEIEKVVGIAKKSFDALIGKHAKLLLFGLDSTHFRLNHLFGRGEIEENTAVIDINDIRRFDIKYVIVQMSISTDVDVLQKVEMNSKSEHTEVPVLRWVLLYDANSGDAQNTQKQKIENVVRLRIKTRRGTEEEEDGAVAEMGVNPNYDVLMHTELAHQRMEDIRILEDETEKGHLGGAVDRKEALINTIESKVAEYCSSDGDGEVNGNGDGSKGCQLISPPTRKVVETELKRHKRTLSSLQMAERTGSAADIQNATLQQHYAIVCSSNSSQLHDEL